MAKDKRGNEVEVEPYFGVPVLASAGLRSPSRLYWHWWLRNQLIEAAYKFYEDYAPPPKYKVTVTEHVKG